MDKLLEKLIPLFIRIAFMILDHFMSNGNGEDKRVASAHVDELAMKKNGIDHSITT